MGLEGVEGISSASGASSAGRSPKNSEVELEELQRDHLEEREQSNRDRDFTDPSLEDIAKHVDSLNELVRTFDKGFEFQVHDKSEEYYVQVVDLVEDEIIREIPPEQIMDIMARIDNMIGIIVDERV